MEAFRRMLGKRLRVGRAALPLWSVLAATALVAGVAGQALGPVLAGGGSGNVGVVASQNLFFTEAAAAAGHSGSDGIDQAAASIDTAGLILNGAFRMHRNDDASTVDFVVRNRGDNTKAAELKLTRPWGSSVNLKENDFECKLAQMSINNWNNSQGDVYLLTVTSDPDADGDTTPDATDGDDDNDTVADGTDTDDDGDGILDVDDAVGCDLVLEVRAGSAEPLGSYAIAVQMQERA